MQNRRNYNYQYQIKLIKHILYKNINVTCVEDWPSIVYNLVICSSFKEIKNIRDVILMQNSTLEF